MVKARNQIIKEDPNTFLEINLKSLKRNYDIVKKKVSSDCSVAATVKANAYGLGVEPVAKLLIKNKCNNFFVATLSEGVELRKLNKKILIYVLNGLNDKKINLFYKYNLVPVINNLNQLKKAEKFTLKLKKSLKIALHFDTGMSRLGFDSQETEFLIKNKHKLIKQTKIILIMSHLACADNPMNKKNRSQLNSFKKISKHFPEVKLSLANSAGILLGKEYHFDVARPGISLYGGQSTLNEKNIYNPVVSLKAPIIQTRRINKGQTIGYGATFKAKKKMLIGTIPVGYADGFNRLLSNQIDLYFRGEKVKLVGRISMDLVTVDLSKFMKNKKITNNYIELINKKNNINYLSKVISTIPYEILTSLGKRYQRRYIA